MLLSAGKFFGVRFSLACFVCCYRSHGCRGEGGTNSACGVVGLQGIKKINKKNGEKMLFCFFKLKKNTTSLLRVYFSFIVLVNYLQNLLTD